MGERAHYPLITAKWPIADARALDVEAGPEIDWVIRTTQAFRALRSDLNIPYSVKLTPRLVERTELDEARLDRHFRSIMRMAGLTTFMVAGRRALFGNFQEDPEIAFDQHGRAVIARNVAQIVVDGATYILPLEGLIDVESERARLAKAAEAAEKERDSLAGRLANPSFVERAKPEAVEKARADHAEKASDAEKYRAALARLG